MTAERVMIGGRFVGSYPRETRYRPGERVLIVATLQFTAEELRLIADRMDQIDAAATGEGETA